MSGFLVKVTWFKSGGKYYAEGEYWSELTTSASLYEYHDEFRRKLVAGNRLGLVDGGFEAGGLIALVEVPDHPNNCPRLVIPKVAIEALYGWAEPSIDAYVGKLDNAKETLNRVSYVRTQHDQMCAMLKEAEMGVREHDDDLKRLLSMNQNPGCGGDSSIDEARWNWFADRMRKLGLWP